MNLFAKGHKYNPLTDEEKKEVAARDNRPVWEIWADQKKEHGIDKMSDDELQALYESLTPRDELMQAVRHEVRTRENARDTRTVEQQWVDAVSANPNILN